MDGVLKKRKLERQREGGKARAAKFRRRRKGILQQPIEDQQQHEINGAPPAMDFERRRDEENVDERDTDIPLYAGEEDGMELSTGSFNNSNDSGSEGAEGGGGGDDGSGAEGEEGGGGGDDSNKWAFDADRYHGGDDKVFSREIGGRIAELVARGQITKTAAQKVLEMSYEFAEDFARTKRRKTAKRSAKWLIRRAMREATPGITTTLFRISEDGGGQEAFANSRILSKCNQTIRVCKRVTSMPLAEIRRMVYKAHGVDEENPPDEWRRIEIGSDGFTPAKKTSWGFHKVSVRFLKCGAPTVWFLHQFNTKRGGSVDTDSIMRPIVEELLELGELKLVRVIGDAKERKMQKGMSGTGAYQGCEFCEAHGVQLPGGGKKKRVSFPRRVQVGTRRTRDGVIELLLQEGVDGRGKLQKPKDGIVSWSPLLDVPGFDMIYDGPLDSMHLMGGLVEKLYHLLFKLPKGKGKGKGKGESNRKTQAIRARRKLQALELDELQLRVRVPSEVGRRPREIAISRMKTSEWKVLGMHMFPHIAQSSIMTGSHSRCRKILFLLSYVFRAINVSDENWTLLGPHNVQRAVRRLQRLYELEFGEGISTFNEHCAFSHLVENRERHGPMHNYSAWRYEDVICKIQKSYRQGTPHEGLQVFENFYYKYCKAHTCPGDQRLVILPKTESSRKDDSLVCTEDGIFQVGRVLQHEQFECTRVDTRTFSTADFNLQELRWGLVGVFRLPKSRALTGDKKYIIKRKDVTGKAMIVGETIVTMPREWLFE